MQWDFRGCWAKFWLSFLSFSLLCISSFLCNNSEAEDMYCYCPHPLCYLIQRPPPPKRGGRGRECKEVRIGTTGRTRVLADERPMGTSTCGGKVFKEKTRVSGERPISATSFRQQSMQAPPPPPRAVSP